mmetsp:Transcript_34985/g.91567  ORF Transcript_34985/g.91567 Transcript_34985/m.91567 type:complete len:374 (+) Transcript_34985:338-1459(+)
MSLYHRSRWPSEITKEVFKSRRTSWCRINALMAPTTSSSISCGNLFCSITRFSKNPSSSSQPFSCRNCRANCFPWGRAARFHTQRSVATSRSKSFPLLSAVDSLIRSWSIPATDLPSPSASPAAVATASAWLPNPAIFPRQLRCARSRDLIFVPPMSLRKTFKLKAATVSGEGLSAAGALWARSREMHSWVSSGYPASHGNTSSGADSRYHPRRRFHARALGVRLNWFRTASASPGSWKSWGTRLSRWSMFTSSKALNSSSGATNPFKHRTQLIFSRAIGHAKLRPDISTTNSRARSSTCRSLAAPSSHCTGARAPRATAADTTGWLSASSTVRTSRVLWQSTRTLWAQSPVPWSLCRRKTSTAGRTSRRCFR